MEPGILDLNHKNKSLVILFLLAIFLPVVVLIFLLLIDGVEMEVETNPITISSNNLVHKESPQIDRNNITKSETGASKVRKKPSSISLRLDGGKSSLKRFLKKVHDALQFFHDKIKLAHHEFSDTDDDSDDEYSDSQILFLEDVFENADASNGTDYDELNFGLPDSDNNIIITSANSTTIRKKANPMYNEFIDTVDYSKYPTLKTNNDEDYLDGQLLWNERRKLWNTKLLPIKQSNDVNHRIQATAEKSGGDSHSSMDDNNINDQPKESSSNSSFLDSNHNISSQKLQIPTKKYHLFYKYFILQSKRLKNPIGLDQLAPIIQNEWKYIDEIGSPANRSKSGSAKDTKKWKSGQYPVNYSRSIYGRG